MINQLLISIQSNSGYCARKIMLYQTLGSHSANSSQKCTETSAMLSLIY